MTLTTAEQEQLYDLQKSGELYIKAEPAPSLREQVLAQLDEMRPLPSGEKIYDLLAEDRIARYVWWRCVDWVLYRLAHGLPISRLNDDDAVPPAFDACFTATAARLNELRAMPARPPLNALFSRGWDLSNATTQENWERDARLSNLKAWIGQRVDVSARTAVVAERCILDDDLDPRHSTAIGTNRRTHSAHDHLLERVALSPERALAELERGEVVRLVRR